MATKKKTELKKMTLKSLIEYFNEITDGTPVKKFPSKDVAIRRVEAAQRAAKKSNARSTGAKKTGSKRKDGPSRYQMIRDTFAKKKKATREELMKLTGWDSNSVHVAMSILKNPTRTKPENQVVTEFDKEKGVYVRA